MHLDRPVNDRGLLLYEVWIGDRALEEYEEPDGSMISGIVFRFNVSSSYIYIYIYEELSF